MIVSIFGQSGRRDTNVIASHSLSIGLCLLEPQPFLSSLAGLIKWIQRWDVQRVTALLRFTVIYCTGRPFLVCHDNYMISDCRCKGGSGAGALLTCAYTASMTRNKTCWESMQSCPCASGFCVSLLPSCLCCTSRPRHRPAADPNLSAASPSVLHHPRQDRHTSGFGRAHNVCFWVPHTSLAWFCTQHRVINLK